MFDLLIICGGVNGCGIAADAAGRGLKVILCEQDDLASATSSRSSKLIHGGLRYLEYFEFRLVREALKEREILLKKAPHIIHPLRFIMPYNSSLRPMWMLRAGFFLYDHLGGHSSLPKSQSINFSKHSAGKLLQKQFTKGFAYSDCRVDDARLVVLNAMLAHQKGAVIRTRTQLVSAQRQTNHWQIELQNVMTKEKQSIRAKALINAAGPWVDDVIDNKLGLTSKNRIALVKGSHIVVPQLYPEPFAFILQNFDKRVIFVIPYLGAYSLIGTTDIPFKGDPKTVEISLDEIAYLCKAINYYFEKPISPQDIIWSYAGVRALQSDASENPSAITRDYALELNSAGGQAPLLSVFGGKITTYRKLAEQALNDLKPFFSHCGPAWTAHAPLPGGDIPNADFARFSQQFQNQYAWLPMPLADRYARNYGTLASKILGDANSLSALGQHFGANLYQREVDYLVENEWAKTAEDILWRRTKLGLNFSVEEENHLESALQRSC